MEQNINNVAVCQDESGAVKVNARFASDDVWLSQQQLVEIYDTTQRNVASHIQNIFSDNELLGSEAARKKFLLVRKEGQRQVQRDIDHYNLGTIIALGYGV